MNILNIEFFFSDIDNPMMLMIQGNKIFPNELGKGIFTTEITLPSKIYLEVSKKGKNDTVVDSQGNIIKDKFIRIEKVQINGITPHLNFIKKWPRLMIGGHGSNQIVYSDYFGFNGIVELEFDGNNVFQWLLRTNNFRDENWHKTY